MLSYTDNVDEAKSSLHVGECDELLTRTLKFWEDWAARCTYRGPYKNDVLRSAKFPTIRFEATAVTDAVGRFSLRLRPGRYQVVIAGPGAKAFRNGNPIQPQPNVIVVAGGRANQFPLVIGR